MATFYKRGSRWRVQVRRDGRSLSQTFENKQDAQRWARQQEADIERARAIPAGLRLTFGELVETYLDGMDGKRMGTTKLWTIKRLQQSLARLRLEEINKRSILNYVQTRENEGAGPATVLTDLGYLRTVLLYGGSMCDGEEAAALALTHLSAARALLTHACRAAPSRRRERRPTEDELARLEQYFYERPRSTTPMWDIALFAICTCLRLGELVQVQWDHIDFEKRTLFVPDRKDPRAVDGNNGVIPLLCGPVDIFQKQVDPVSILTRQKTARQRAGRVFPVCEQTVTVAWGIACRSCGVENLHFHDLRHDGVSRLFEAGYDIPQVAVVSGHKSWKHLQRYTNLRAVDLHRLE